MGELIIDASEQQSEFEDRDMLLECFHENLTQARHVENERMMFVTLFTALVGGAFGMLSNIESAATNLIVLLILLMLNVVCLMMTERWSDVFDAHMLTAQRLYLRLCAAPGDDLTQAGALCEQRILHHPDINKLYIFNQSKYQKEQKGRRWLPYIRTRTWFRLFNVLLMALLLLSMACHIALVCSNLQNLGELPAIIG